MAARPFIEVTDFINNAFQRRFQPILHGALRDHTWHVVGAVPGSGKSKGIADLVYQYRAAKDSDGRTSLQVLAVRAPKNQRSEIALGLSMSRSFGLTPNMPWSIRRSWLVDEMARAGVDLIAIDDAHDMSIDQLAYLKELSDNLEAPPYQRAVGLCLVAACDSSDSPYIPIVETLRLKQDYSWKQFRRRFDATSSFRRVLGHTAEELQEILVGYEDAYRDQFPDLHLAEHTPDIYRWLTHPVLDPGPAKRVAMAHVRNLVVASLKEAHLLGYGGVPKEILHKTAQAMTLRRDEIADVDGEPQEGCILMESVG